MHVQQLLYDLQARLLIVSHCFLVDIGHLLGIVFDLLQMEVMLYVEIAKQFGHLTLHLLRQHLLEQD